MQPHHPSTRKNSIDIALRYYEHIAALFRFGADGPDLVASITFESSQTLQRQQRLTLNKMG